jgi:hypothetical protein
VTLDNLIGISLEKITPHQDAINRLLHAAERNIVDSKIDLVSVENRFDAAYTLLSGIPGDIRPLPSPSVINLGGVTVVKRDGKTVVSGNTFPIKQILKNCGFKWNKEDKVWWCYGAYSIENYLGC